MQVYKELINIEIVIFHNLVICELKDFVNLNFNGKINKGPKLLQIAASSNDIIMTFTLQPLNCHFVLGTAGVK